MVVVVILLSVSENWHKLCYFYKADIEHDTVCNSFNVTYCFSSNFVIELMTKDILKFSRFVVGEAMRNFF